MVEAMDTIQHGFLIATYKEHITPRSRVYIAELEIILMPRPNAVSSAYQISSLHRHQTALFLSPPLGCAHDMHALGQERSTK